MARTRPSGVNKDPVVIKSDDTSGFVQSNTGTITPISAPGLTLPVGFIDRSFVPRRRTDWRKWEPTWDAATTSPALGNGTLEAWYLYDNRWMELYLELTAGSTTTFGTGSWTFTGLPALPATFRGVGWSTCYDVSGNATFSGWVQIRNGDEFRPSLPSASTAGAHVGLTSAVPFTWADTDQLVMYGKFRYAD